MFWNVNNNMLDNKIKLPDLGSVQAEYNDMTEIIKNLTVESTDEYKKLQKENEALIEIIRPMAEIGFCSYCDGKNAETTKRVLDAMDRYGELVGKK